MQRRPASRRRLVAHARPDVRPPPVQPGEPAAELARSASPGGPTRCARSPGTSSGDEAPAPDGRARRPGRAAGGRAPGRRPGPGRVRLPAPPRQRRPPGESRRTPPTRSRTRREWYVDPKEPAFATLLQYGTTSPRGKLMARIALTPRFKWFGRFTSAPRTICRFIQEAEIAGKVPLIATLRHQGKQCNSALPGRRRRRGQRDQAVVRRLRARRRELAGDHRVRARLASARSSAWRASRRQARIDAARYGVDVLSKLPNATVYIEATAVGLEVGRLRRQQAAPDRRGQGARVHAQRDPLRLDAATTSASAAGCPQRLGGKHFVISTAMNGRGPVHYQRGKRRINVLLPPALPRRRPVPQHQDGGSAGGRVRLDQPRRATPAARATAARFPWAPGGPSAP